MRPADDVIEWQWRMVGEIAAMVARIEGAPNPLAAAFAEIDQLLHERECWRFEAGMRRAERDDFRACYQSADRAWELLADDLDALEPELDRVRAMNDALRKELAALKAARGEQGTFEASLDMRTTFPTDAEIEAIVAQGGRFLCSSEHFHALSITHPSDVRTLLRSLRSPDSRASCRYWAVDADNRPRAWPKVEGVSR